jgi:hypothetical protein
MPAMHCLLIALVSMFAGEIPAYAQNWKELTLELD